MIKPDSSLVISDTIGPELTVAMTTYNGEATLRNTIDSILTQTFTDFEFLIIDDASTDNTRDLILSYNDPRIRFVPNARNIGISRSRNRAIDLARGRFIATTDQDDLSKPTRLGRQVAYLKDNPTVTAVASTVDEFVYGKRRKSHIPFHPNAAAVHFALFFGWHNITYSALCARLDLLRQLPEIFRPQYHYAEDFELYHRIADVGRIEMIPEPLVTYCIHGENNSVTRYKKMSSNGRAFLREAYSKLLARAVSEDDIRAVWQIFVEQKPAVNLDELDAAGNILCEVLERFEGLRPYDECEINAVRQLAATIWWAAIRTSAPVVGVPALQGFKRRPRLDPWGPSRASQLIALTKAMFRKHVGRAADRNQ